MANLGTAYVQIVPSATGISGKISSAIAPEATSAGSLAGQTISRGIGSSLMTAGKGMINAGKMATLIAVPLVAGIKKAMDAYKTQNLAETKLTEIYKTRMGVTKEAAQATIDYAGALQKQGVIGDEVLISGAQQLATFARYPQTVNSLLPAMGNLLAQQKGLNATSQDATQIGNLMGKVMQGQTGALKRVGVTFDEAQEKVLKYGTEQEKAAMLAEVITQNVGNMNAALLETPEGKIQSMKNAFGDLAEQLGATLAPALADLANWISANLIPKLQAFMDKMQNNPAFGKFVVGITGVLAAGGPLLMVLGKLTSGIGGLLVKFSGAGGAVGGFSKVLGLLGGPVGIAVAAFAALFAGSSQFREAVIGLVQAVGAALMPVIQQLQPILSQLMSTIMQVISTIGSALAPVIQQLIPIVTQVVTVVGQIASTILSALMPMIQALMPLIQQIATVVSTVMQTILSIVGPVINAIVSIVVPAITGLLNAVTTCLTTMVSIITSAMNKAKSIFMTVWNFIKGFVTGAVNGVKTAIQGLSSIIGNVKSTFNSVKEAIKQPIEAAKDKVKGVVDKIKGMFPMSIGKIFDNIKLPHISVQGGKAPFGIGGKGSLPHFSVTWGAKGGILNAPNLIGAGEAGKEALLPLDPFWNQLDAAVSKQGIDYNMMASAMVSALSQVDMVNELVVDGRVVAKATAPYMQTEQNRLTKMNNRKLGYAGV